MVREIPRGVHEPGESDEPIRSEPSVQDGYDEDWIDQFPDAKAPTEVHTRRACNEHGVEPLPHGFRHSLHEQHEQPRTDDGPDVVHHEERRPG